MKKKVFALLLASLLVVSQMGVALSETEVISTPTPTLQAIIGALMGEVSEPTAEVTKAPTDENGDDEEEESTDVKDDEETGDEEEKPTEENGNDKSGNEEEESTEENGNVKSGDEEEESTEENGNDKSGNEEEESTEENGNDKSGDEEEESTDENGNDKPGDEEEESTEENGNDESGDEEEESTEENTEAPASQFEVHVDVLDPKTEYYSGDVISLIARIEGTIGQPAYQWQVLHTDEPGAEWEDIEGETQQIYEFVINDDNYMDAYRVIVADLETEAAE